MKKMKRVIAVLVLLGAIGFGAWVWWPREGGRYLSGWVEGDTLFLSAATSGAVARLDVRRGQRVEAGAPVFLVDPQPLAAERASAEAALKAAASEAEDALKGQRPQELAVIEAQRAAARATFRQAEADYQRAVALAKTGFLAKAGLDQATATYQTAQAQLRETEKRLDVAELGAREDLIKAAQARTAQAAGTLDETEARLRQLAPVAPATGRIEDTFFQPGEWVPANQPVVSLIPDDQVKLRFFVPEGEIAAYRYGREVAFSCDGCAKGLKATINYVSPRPEFTPPVIYSRETRDRLVFLVEARPTNPRALTVGQPVDVTPLPKAPGR
ncbi:HlyD family efflux transporter periplasmic adaptor subunit [Caulobacter sp. 17J65-9]|uniref:HlyD family secretion protein n=1 Tax=Caulobacter sp. 17J65-9 TaxID=2709382 RepID=UPI0013C70809|nr:HlyD family efflux transporter periplasmic adaptor subunit [Caulobacter sp. 17J65-9]NEX91811.1 HlyD family efflux transporter periplasmic adaptor subunit [Caulobacter sp. 17J65-9]